MTWDIFNLNKVIDKKYATGQYHPRYVCNLTQLVIKHDNFIGHPFNMKTCGCDVHYGMNNTACSRLISIILSQLLQVNDGVFLMLYLYLFYFLHS